MDDVTPETIVRQVVRGERDVSELRSAGILVLPAGDGYEIVNDGEICVVVGPVDVAAGIVAFAGDPAALAEWASILLAGAIFVDLSMDNAPGGEQLLEALWNLSYGQPLDEAALRLARQITRDPSRER